MMYTSLVYVYMSVIQCLHSVSGHPILAELGPDVDGIRGRLSWHMGVSLRKGNDATYLQYALRHGLHRPTIIDIKWNKLKAAFALQISCIDTDLPSTADIMKKERCVYPSLVYQLAAQVCELFSGVVSFSGS